MKLLEWTFSNDEYLDKSRLANAGTYATPKSDKISKIHNIRHIRECLGNNTVYSNSMKDTICKIGNFVRIYF